MGKNTKAPKAATKKKTEAKSTATPATQAKVKKGTSNPGASSNKKPGPTQRKITEFSKNITAALYLQQKQAAVAGFSSPVDVISSFVTARVNALSTSAYTFFGYQAGQNSASSEPSVDERINADMEALANQCKLEDAKIDAINAKLKKEGISDKEVKQLKLEKRQAFAKKDIYFLEQINLAPELVKEHAVRRVDLFFYLLIAVYKKQLFFDVKSKKGTSKQHGKGSSKRGTAGCHSSLVTSVKSAIQIDEAENASQQTLLSQVIAFFEESTVTDTSFYEAYVNAMEEPENVVEEDDTDEEDGFLTGTHLIEMLNEVVELPDIVNKLDCGIETGGNKITTKACLGIVNLVSKGEINPIVGMLHFSRVMHLCFEALKYNYCLIAQEKSDNSKSNYPLSIARAIALEKAGTFSVFCKDSLQLLPEYVEMHLQLNRFIRDLPVQDLLIAGVSDKVLDRVFLAKQQEIMESSPICSNKKALSK